MVKMGTMNSVRVLDLVELFRSRIAVRRRCGMFVLCPTINGLENALA
jgi:hypothetical protein